MANPLAILGLSQMPEELDELKSAYKKQALRLHPDKNQNSPEATERFKELNEAFRELEEQLGSANKFEEDITNFLRSFGAPIFVDIRQNKNKPQLTQDIKFTFEELYYATPRQVTVNGIKINVNPGSQIREHCIVNNQSIVFNKTVDIPNKIKISGYDIILNVGISLPAFLFKSEFDIKFLNKTLKVKHEMPRDSRFILNDKLTVVKKNKGLLLMPGRSEARGNLIISLQIIMDPDLYQGYESEIRNIFSTSKVSDGKQQQDI